MTRDTDEIDIIDDEDKATDDALATSWWAQLPDFIKPSYPFDLPPERLPFAQFVFTEVGAPRRCPEAACRRAGACGGGDGPPCFRAARKYLWHVLFLWWMRSTPTARTRNTKRRCAPKAARTRRTRRRRRGPRKPRAGGGGADAASMHAARLGRSHTLYICTCA